LNRLRRTASYSNIQIQEATNEEEDEDEEELKASKNGHIISPWKQRHLQLKALRQHEKFTKASKGAKYLNQAREDARSYFEQGSSRNTAHDEEFFHCFVQYLDEAIKRLKEQGGYIDLDEDQEEEETAE